MIFLTESKCKIRFIYGRKSADRAEPDFDVIFLVFLRPIYYDLKFCNGKNWIVAQNICVAKCVHISVWTTQALFGPI